MHHDIYFSFYSIDRLGLDSKLLAKILNTSSGRCWSSEVYNPCPGVLEGVPSSNNYQGGFGTALMTKVGVGILFISKNDVYIQRYCKYFITKTDI